MAALLLEVRAFCAFTYPDTATARLVRFMVLGKLLRRRAAELRFRRQIGIH
jgi:hypothetical protein